MKDWLFEPLPTNFTLLLSLTLTVVILMLALTRLRGTWLASLAAGNMAFLLLWTSLLNLFELPPWRLQVVIERLVELPLVCGLAVLCFVQARRLLPSEHRLRQVLQAAPALLVFAWVVAFVGEQIWPQPSLNTFAEMPIRNWALLTVLCVPFQSYVWILTFLFVRASGSRSPTLRLRAQNAFLAVAIGGYGLSSVNVLVGYAVQAFLENLARREITLVQFLIEERLLLVWAPALLLGLLLAASPAATRIARAADTFALLSLRERFEGLAWRLEATGALRRLARPLHHLQRAADTLGLSEADAAKALQAVKLAAVMGSPRVPADLSREKASELLSRLEVAGALGTVPSTPWPSGGKRSAALADPADLPEILDAALDLSAPAENPLRANRPPWFELARAACIDAGIVEAASPRSPDYERAVVAYCEAANLVRGA